MPHTYRDFLSEDESRPGRLYFGGARMALLDIEAGFWALRRQMEALAGRRLTDAVLQQAGANGGASFARAFAPDVPPEATAQALRDCVAAYQAAGFGQFEIEALEWPIGRVLIRGTDTFEAWMMHQHGQVTESPVCAYSAGVFVGFVNALSGRHDVVCIKRACQARGDDACLFELVPADQAGDSAAVAFDPDPLLSHQLNLLEILFDRMPMGIAIFDRDFVLRRCNPTWAEFIDRYTPSSAGQVVPGRDLFDLAPGTETAMAPIIKQVLGGQTVRQEALRLESGGIVSYWDVAFTPLMQNGEVTGIVDVTTDATERVLAYQELEQRVADRTRELSALHDVTAVASESLELKRVLERSLSRVLTVMGCEMGAIHLLEEKEGMLRLAASQGIPSAILDEMAPVPVEGGLAGWAVEHGELLVVPHIAIGPRPLIAIPAADTQAYVGAPMRARSRVLGVLSVVGPTGQQFSVEEVSLLSSIADEVGVAVENARLFDAERERRRQTDTLLQAASVVTSTLELDELLTRILDQLRRVVSYDSASVQLLKGEGLQVIAVHGFSAPEQVLDITFSPQERLPNWTVVHEGRSLNLADVPALYPEFRQPTDCPIRSWLGVPLRVQERCIGMITVDREQPGGYTEEEVRLASAFADLAALSLENARLYQQAEQLAVVRERERMARDLHDAVTQSLYSLTLFTEAAQRLVGTGEQERLGEYIARLGETAQQALKDMRLLIHQWRPSALEREGLVGALQQRLNAVEGRAGMDARLLVNGTFELPAPLEEGLYRIAEEALNNALKHATATSVRVWLRAEGNRVELEVADNGRGFDPDAMDDTGGMGLANMRQRAERLGGSLTVHSSLGEGTTLKASLPMGLSGARDVLEGVG
jgi:signal transduction histidine kinase/predicted hydrocarbon binding protein